MNIARKVRQIDGNRGEQFLWKMTPPFEGHEYVITSGLESAIDTGRPETYIFAADETGEITAWNELEGSFRGPVDHAKALAGAGYTVK